MVEETKKIYYIYYSGGKNIRIAFQLVVITAYQQHVRGCS